MPSEPLAALSIGYTPREVAESLRTSPDRVLDWIRSGELQAIDKRAKGAKRATWVIPPAALAKFVAARSTSPPGPRQRRQRKTSGGHVPQYY